MQTRLYGGAHTCWSHGRGARRALSVAGTSKASGMDSAEPLLRFSSWPPCCRGPRGHSSSRMLLAFSSWHLPPLPYILNPFVCCLSPPLDCVLCQGRDSVCVVPTCLYRTRMRCMQPLRICCVRDCAVEGNL